MDKDIAGQETHVSVTTLENRQLLIVLYVTAVFLYWMSQYLYMPTLPLYVRTRTTNLTMVGIVLSMYGLWQAIIRLPLGIAADWLGRRKPLIVVGVALAGIGAWMMGMASSIPILIIGRAITGMAAGTWVLLVVAFCSLFPSEDVVKATAMLTLAGSIGRVLSTSVTGSLNNLGGYSLAFFLAAGAAGLAVLVVLPVHEQRRISQRPSIQQFGKLISSRYVLVPSLLSVISQHAIWSSSYGFIPIVAKQLGANDILQSMLISMNLAVVALGNVMTATLGKYIGARRMVYLSFGLMSGGIIAAAIASSLFPMFVAQFCTGMAWGLGYPVLMGMSIKHVADAERATAMGLHQAIYGIGMFSGPWLSGFLSDVIGIQATFGITALFCLILGLFGTHWLRNSQEENVSSI